MLDDNLLREMNPRSNDSCQASTSRAQNKLDLSICEHLPCDSSSILPIRGHILRILCYDPAVDTIGTYIVHALAIRLQWLLRRKERYNSCSRIPIDPRTFILTAYHWMAAQSIALNTSRIDCRCSRDR